MSDQCSSIHRITGSCSFDHFIIVRAGGAQSDPARHSAGERYLHAHLHARGLDLRLLYRARRAPCPSRLCHRRSNYNQHLFVSPEQQRLAHVCRRWGYFDGRERRGHDGGGACVSVSVRRALPLRPPSFLAGLYLYSALHNTIAIAFAVDFRVPRITIFTSLSYRSFSWCPYSLHSCTPAFTRPL